MKIPRTKRRAIAGVIGAVFLFLMLFTVGSGYFIFVNNANTLYAKTLSNSGLQLASRLNENTIITTYLLSNNHIGFYFNNTSGVTLNVTSAFLMDSSGNILKCLGIGLPSGQSCANTTPALPGIANPGKGAPATGYFDTGYTYVSGTDTFKLITQRGNVFSQTYPPTAVPLAQLAVTTQGAGFLSLDFNSYFGYNTTGSGAGCNPTSAGCQLTPFPGSVLGYTLSSAAKTSRFYLFSISVTNVDPQKRIITLDSNSELIQYLAPTAGGGGGTARAWPWGIGIVSGSGVTQAWSTITITYGQSLTLYFTQTPNGGGNFAANNFPASGNYVGVSIYLHGTVGSSPYGQNIPFVTTLYR